MRRGRGLGIGENPLPVTAAVAQVVEVGDGKDRQSRVFRLAVYLIFVLQDAPGGRPAQGLMRLVDLGQQLDVGARAALCKTAPAVHRCPHLAAGPETGDQPRHLRPAQPHHLFDVAPQAAILAPLCTAGGTAARRAPAPPTRRSARGSCLQTAIPRWLRRTGESPPDSTSLPDAS